MNNIKNERQLKKICSHCSMRVRPYSVILHASMDTNTNFSQNITQQVMKNQYNGRAQ